MARPRRKWQPNRYYHIIMRGNNRWKIFIDNTDMTEYIRVLNYVYLFNSFEVLAYCIVTNHVHLNVFTTPGLYLLLLPRLFLQCFRKPSFLHLNKLPRYQLKRFRALKRWGTDPIIEANEKLSDKQRWFSV